MGRDYSELPTAGDGVDKRQLSIYALDPATSFHALAGEFEELAELHADRLEELDADEDAEAWAQAKGMLDAFRSASIATRTTALSWDARGGGQGREEIRKE